MKNKKDHISQDVGSMHQIISGRITWQIGYVTCTFMKVFLKNGLPTPIQDYWIKGLILTLKKRSYNDLELNIHWSYYE